MYMPSPKQSKTISVPIREYKRLKDIEERFTRVRDIAAPDFFAPPPTRDSKKIIAELRRSGRYNSSFLESVKKGLEESRYFSK